MCYSTLFLFFLSPFVYFSVLCWEDLFHQKSRQVSLLSVIWLLLSCQAVAYSSAMPAICPNSLSFLKRTLCAHSYTHHYLPFSSLFSSFLSSLILSFVLFSSNFFPFLLFCSTIFSILLLSSVFLSYFFYLLPASVSISFLLFSLFFHRILDKTFQARGSDQSRRQIDLLLLCIPQRGMREADRSASIIEKVKIASNVFFRLECFSFSTSPMLCSPIYHISTINKIFVLLFYLSHPLSHTLSCTLFIRLTITITLSLSRSLSSLMILFLFYSPVFAFFHHIYPCVNFSSCYQIPGHALVMQQDRPFRGLASFGNNFLSKFEGAEVTYFLMFPF